MDELVPAVTTQETSPTSTSAEKAHTSRDGKRKAPGGKKKAANRKAKKTATPTADISVPTTMREAMQAFEEQRQIATLLAHAAATIRADFVAHTGPPRLVLESSDGLRRPADVGAVIKATSAINALARSARERALALLQRRLGPGDGATTEPADGGEHQRLGDVVRLASVANPLRKTKEKT